LKAFLLAAGLGERLRPLTELRPKPLFPVGNRPLIEYTVDLVKSYGYNDLIVNLHHLPRQIQTALGNGQSSDVQIEYSLEEPKILGTAGGIKRVEPLLGKETFLVINCDILVRVDLEAALRVHRKNGALATLVVRKYPETPRRPDLAVDGKGRIQRFLGQGKRPDEPGLTNAMFTGITLMEPEMLKEIPPGRFCSISDEIYPRLIERGAPICAWWLDDPWRDVGTPVRYLEANWDVLQGKFGVTPEAGEAIQGISPEKDTTVLEGVEIEGAVILGEDCQIAPGSRLGPNVVIGPGTRIDRNVHLSNSVLWENVVLGEESTAYRVIIGPSVQAPKSLHLQGEIVVGQDNNLQRSRFEQ
jgi:mannose-1-phosphate guanylyltransferase/phosphomannomutase